MTQVDYGPPRKRSLTLRGHRTSVSLEEPFWHAFRALARAENKPLNALAAEIDAARGVGCGLAGAIRLYVLARFAAMYGQPDNHEVTT
ncbi:aryl-sulfate sulfotransferase [Rhodobacteraceae bacterium 2CG4]|uniref:Aryl-sulfate sulfotransferase n=1 Tax=Halovulum marinum TaxID=2662447 RepID=A0A6L5YXH3_9RHOB|nr:ribbon-helix-helix domain-containing protein [Halovulum marinum]MSU89036.1 aryl-sulfate sulfotransferase [Halovulum marinum]